MRTLPLRLGLFLAAATLTGCVAAEPQPETPDTEAARARSIGLYGARRSKRVSSGSRPTLADEESPVRCYGAFSPGADPASDLTRLTAACASPLGLSAVTPVHVGEPQTADAPEERLTFLGRAGRCYRVFAVGEPTIADLDVALIDATGRIAAADASSDRWPIVPTRGSLCLREDQLLTIHAAVMAGSGSYLMQVWSNSTEM
jgi:hypothetical protein